MLTVLLPSGLSKKTRVAAQLGRRARGTGGAPRIEPKEGKGGRPRRVLSPGKTNYSQGQLCVCLAYRRILWLVFLLAPPSGFTPRGAGPLPFNLTCLTWLFELRLLLLVILLLSCPCVHIRLCLCIQLPTLGDAVGLLDCNHGCSMHTVACICMCFVWLRESQNPDPTSE